MKTIIKISERATIAIHTIDYMIRNKEDLYVASEIAKTLDISYNHLSKILQTLARHGYLKTNRGPFGGHTLTEKGKNAKIGEIIELFDGKIPDTKCLMSKKVCQRKFCAFENFLEKMLSEYKRLLSLKIKEI